MISELAAAFVLLTRLPAGRLVRGAWPEPARCVWAYPLVGLAAGAIGAVVLVALERAGVPALPASVVAVGCLALVTGGLHEDGLADCFDALGGATVERRLAIMRDSRIGAHGATALGLVLLLRVSCLASMPAERAGLALVVASVLGRGAMLMVIGGVGPARAGGLAAPLGEARRGRLGVGLALALVAALGVGAGLAAVAAGVAAIVAGRVARVRFGGYTGDVLGATEMLAEAAALLTLVG